MSLLEQQKALVKQSLFQFIDENVPSADFKVIDDIVLSYVISIIEDASSDSCFDVEGLMEMMSAYIPEFAQLDPGRVLGWVLRVDAAIANAGAEPPSNRDDAASTGSDKIGFSMQSLNDMLPPVTKPSRSHSSSESSEAGCRRAPEEVPVQAGWENARSLLEEMFPKASAMEIKHCVTIANGEIAEAAATLLHRRENGQALLPAALPLARAAVIEDSELKSRIIERYSYVDKSADTKEHRPIGPKVEPKKLVRYRDNKIVSLKGERYTEVPKSGCDEENLKKPKKQHCP